MQRRSIPARSPDPGMRRSGSESKKPSRSSAAEGRSPATRPAGAGSIQGFPASARSFAHPICERSKPRKAGKPLCLTLRSSRISGSPSDHKTASEPLFGARSIRKTALWRKFITWDKLLIAKSGFFYRIEHKHLPQGKKCFFMVERTRIFCYLQSRY